MIIPNLIDLGKKQERLSCHKYPAIWADTSFRAECIF